MQQKSPAGLNLGMLRIQYMACVVTIWLAGRSGFPTLMYCIIYCGNLVSTVFLCGGLRQKHYFDSSTDYERTIKPCTFNSNVVCDCIEGYYDANHNSSINIKDCKWCNNAHVSGNRGKRVKMLD